MIKNNFMPLRDFRSLRDANAQLRDWVMGIAGNRIHWTTKEQPLALFAETEKHIPRPLPDVPLELAVKSTRSNFFAETPLFLEIPQADASLYRLTLSKKISILLATLSLVA